MPLLKNPRTAFHNQTSPGPAFSLNMYSTKPLMLLVLASQFLFNLCIIVIVFCTKFQFPSPSYENFEQSFGANKLFVEAVCHSKFQEHETSISTSLTKISNSKQPFGAFVKAVHHSEFQATARECGSHSKIT